MKIPNISEIMKRSPHCVKFDELVPGDILAGAWTSRVTEINPTYTQWTTGYHPYIVVELQGPNLIVTRANASDVLENLGNRKTLWFMIWKQFRVGVDAESGLEFCP